MLDDFASLYQTLFLDKNPDNRVYALEEFLIKNEDVEKSLALDLLHGYQIKPLIRRLQLLDWLMEYTKLPDWLIEESHRVTGDWSETFSLIIGNPHVRHSGYTLAGFMDELNRAKARKDELRMLTFSLWDKLSGPELFFFHRLVLGTYKPLLEKGFLARFISKRYQLEQSLVSFRLNHPPIQPAGFPDLIDPAWQETEIHAKPFLFREVVSQPAELASLMSDASWIAEPFVPGIRVQVHFKKAEVHIWGLGDEYIPSPFEDPLSFFGPLPEGTVLEGILIDPAAGKAQVTGGKAKKESEWKFVVFDLLQLDYEDFRRYPLSSRKEKLYELFKDSNQPNIRVLIFEVLESYKDLDIIQSVTGWVLKSSREPYHVEQFPWIRLKPGSRQVNAILMYAEAIPSQPSGYRCTFGVYNQDQTLVPIVKLTMEDLSDPMATRLHYWIQNNTIQRFGPVRLVRPQQVFQLVFDDVIENQRLKAGLSLKNAKILAWLPDRDENLEISTLDHLKNQTDPSAPSIE